MVDYSQDCHIAHDEAGRSCEIRFHCFDTFNSVTVFGVDGVSAEGLLREVHETCLDFHRLWSFSLVGSDIARINEPVARCRVDFRTTLLLSAMKAFHDVEPSFDFTVGSVSYLWKHADHVPSDKEAAAALAHVGADLIVVEDDVVVKADPLVQVDVGGAAKGFAADAIAAHLRMAGVTSARIDLGGNLYMIGSHPAGRPWRVAVRLPEGSQVERPVVEVRDKAVVTSGGYERSVEIDGVRYHHIIDAATGKPSESGVISATVVAASALQADMLATTALLAGADGIAGLRARHSDAEIIAIASDAEGHMKADRAIMPEYGKVAREDGDASFDEAVRKGMV